MTSITPTYDFTVNQVPTRETLREQALSLQISGIDISALAADVAGFYLDTNSASTAALQLTSPVGSLWVDRIGNVWVHEGAGPVKLWRFEHGWDSRRYWFDQHPTDGRGLPGYPVQNTSQVGPFEEYDRTINQTALPRIPAAPITGATDPNDYSRFQYFQQTMIDNSNVAFHGVLQETATSGYRAWNGRGGTKFRNVDTGSAVESYEVRLQINHVLTRQNGTIGVDPNVWATFLGGSGDLSGHRYTGYLAHKTVNSSVATDANFATRAYIVKVEHFGMNFGVEQRIRQTIGPLVGSGFVEP